MYISVKHTVRLKEIKQLVFEQQPFGVFQVFKSIDTCIKLSKSITQSKVTHSHWPVHNEVMPT